MSFTGVIHEPQFSSYQQLTTNFLCVWIEPHPSSRRHRTPRTTYDGSEDTINDLTCVDHLTSVANVEEALESLSISNHEPQKSRKVECYQSPQTMQTTPGDKTDPTPCVKNDSTPGKQATLPEMFKATPGIFSSIPGMTEAAPRAKIGGPRCFSKNGH